MSNGNQVARIALVAVGAYFGGPIGAQVGAIAGQLLFPGELPDIVGPRVSDLRVSSSAYGKDIREAFGTFRMIGDTIWSKGIDERTNESEEGGKGGPTRTTTTYSYSSSFAVALCEGEISGVRKIWADGILIFDIGDSASATQVLVSNQSGMTIYNGSESQTPDPTMQASLGIDNTPAMRGLAYLVFNNLELEKYGNRIPNITAEVVGLGAIGYTDTDEFSIPDEGGNLLENNAGVSMYYTDWVTSYFVRTAFTDSSRKTIRVREYSVTPSNEPIFIRMFDIASDTPVSEFDWPITPGSSNQNMYVITSFFRDDDLVKWRAFHLIRFDSGTYDSALSMIGIAAISPSDRHMWTQWDDDVFISIKNVIYISRAGNLMIDTNIDVANDMNNPAAGAKIAGLRSNSEYLFAIRQTNISAKYSVLKYDRKDFSFIAEITFSIGSILAFDVAGIDDVFYPAGTTIRIHENFSSSYTKTVNLPWDATKASADDKWNFWLSGDHNTFFFWSSKYSSETDYRIRYSDFTPEKVTLASVITKICLKCGLSSSDIDVSSLTQMVKGIDKPQAMTGSVFLKSLLDAYNVVAYESNWVLTFRTKGTETSEVIIESELNASEPDQTRKTPLKIERLMEDSLPRRIEVTYYEEGTGYQQAGQFAQRIIK